MSAGYYEWLNGPRDYIEFKSGRIRKIESIESTETWKVINDEVQIKSSSGEIVQSVPMWMVEALPR